MVTHSDMEEAIGGVLREWYAEDSDEKYDRLVARVMVEAIAPHFDCPRQHTWPIGHPLDIKPWSEWDQGDLDEALLEWEGHKPAEAAADEPESDGVLSPTPDPSEPAPIWPDRSES